MTIGDKFGESLGGSQTPSFWEVPGLPRKFPKLPRKFFGDFPGSSLTVELYSNPGVPRKFPKLPRKFPKLPRKFPGLPRRSALSLGKPDTLSGLAKTFPETRGTQFWGPHFCCILGTASRQPPPANPFSKLLTKQGRAVYGPIPVKTDLPTSGEIRMDQPLVHAFSWGNSYRPMVLTVLHKSFPLHWHWSMDGYSQQKRNEFRVKKEVTFHDGGTSALVIGLYWRQILRHRKHCF